MLQGRSLLAFGMIPSIIRGEIQTNFPNRGILPHRSDSVFTAIPLLTYIAACSQLLLMP